MAPIPPNCSKCSKYDVKNILEFNFETSNLALLDNEDLFVLLSIEIELETKKSMTIQDIETLENMKKEALSDINGFIEKMKKEVIEIPPEQKIPKIPDKILQKIKASLVQKDETIQYNSQPKYLWSDEEQKKLEYLLYKYPAENIDLNRYRKIAAELGTKTVTQVASRVQKYFIKLSNEGLSIPGGSSKIHHKKKHNDSNCLIDKKLVEKYEEANAVPVLATTELRLNLLRKIRDELAVYNVRSDSKSDVIHDGYQCTICLENPIEGIRWHCADCFNTSIDFCTDCLTHQCMTSQHHLFSHSLIPLHKAEKTEIHYLKISSDVNDRLNLYDSDYDARVFEIIPGNYNYLDPNFMPL